VRKAIVFAILLFLGLFFTARSSCSNKDMLPYLGKWPGGFVVSEVRRGPNTSVDQKRSSLKGFVQIYATNHKFKLHLEGEQETIDVDGDWTRKAKRMDLRVQHVVIDDQGGAALRDPNRKFILPDDIRAAYSRPLILDLSADGKNLNGLPMSIGDLTGRHLFAKETY